MRTYVALAVNTSLIDVDVNKIIAMPKKVVNAIETPILFRASFTK